MLSSCRRYKYSSICNDQQQSTSDLIWYIELSKFPFRLRPQICFFIKLTAFSSSAARYKNLRLQEQSNRWVRTFVPKIWFTTRTSSAKCNTQERRKRLGVAVGEKNGKLHDAMSAWLQQAAPSALAGHVSPRKLLITVTHLHRLSQTASKPQPISLDRGTSLDRAKKYRLFSMHAFMRLKGEKRQQIENAMSFCAAYRGSINLEPVKDDDTIAFESRSLPR